MQDLIDALRGIVDQFNPLSTQNLIIYFVWLFLYLITAMAIWRSSRRWIRLLAFVVNQVVSIGVLVSLINIIVPAVVLWKESIALAVVTIGLGWLVFRKRKAKELTENASSPSPDSSLPPDGQLSADEVQQLTSQWMGGTSPQHQAPAETQAGQTYRPTRRGNQ